jgi:sugar (pentulose or hexulose) kinase
MPVRAGWPAELVHDGVDVFPHPGPTGFGLAVFNPNGMSIIDWARNIFHLSIQELDQDLVLCNQAPGSVFANAAFTPLPHGGSGDGGLLSNLTLSTTGPDIVRALFEAIAGDFSLAVERLRQRGIETNLVRASGGGAKSSWLMQLHADVSGLPVEVTTHDEPGTFGAAILAGVGAGIYPSVSAAVTHLVRMSRRFDPDPSRGALYAGVRERLAFYQNSPNEQDR